MKARLEQLDLTTGESFTFHIARHPYFHTPLHYHPAYEIIYIRESVGIRIAGDHSAPFQGGQLAMLGPGLPHVWKNDEKYTVGAPGLMAEAWVIHFGPEFWGEQFTGLPECQTIRQLFRDASRGILFSDKVAARAGRQLETLQHHHGINRVYSFIRLLNALAGDRDRQILASVGYSDFPGQDPRIRKVIDHILANYTGELGEAAVSELIGMQPGAFSRFFRANVYKTFKRFVIELRLSHACKLLMESNKPVSAVCYESGFNNISNFNELFRKHYHETPGEYRRRIAAA